ncbi:MAG: hypothetical protein AAGC88_03155 [Bacteroidota bacterium]
MQLKEGAGIVKYLKQRGLFDAYKKAKKFFENDDFKIIDAKPRKPKSAGIYQFRITKKYRAYYVKTDKGAVVFKISDHQ